MTEQAFAGSAQRRAAAYWFIDGLPEIVAGAAFVVLGGGLLWFHHIQPHTWSVRAPFVALGILSLLVVFVYDRSISLFLKSRLTFPRTGYVRPPSDAEQVSRRETFTSLGLGRDQRPPDENVTDFRSSTVRVVICGQVLAGMIAKPIGLPIAMSAAAILLFALHRNSERPYHWASVLPLPAAGLGAMCLNLGQDDNSCTAVLIGGVWLSVRGAWTLLGYVRRHPTREPVESLRP